MDLGISSGSVSPANCSLHYQDAAVLRDASEAVGELLGEDPDLISGDHENLRHYLEAFLMREQNQMSL